MGSNLKEELWDLCQEHLEKLSFCAKLDNVELGMSLGASPQALGCSPAAGSQLFLDFLDTQSAT